MHDIELPPNGGDRDVKSVTVSRRSLTGGEFRVEEGDALRIYLHRSAATRTYCGSVGKYFVRHVDDIDIVPADEPGGFEAETNFEALEISIPRAMISDVASTLGPKKVRQLEARHIFRDERIAQLARVLELDRQAGQSSEPLFVASVGLAIATRLLSLEPDPEQRVIRLSDVQLKRVLDFIEANIDTPLSLDVLSRVAGVSNSHLRTWFKAATGYSVHRYVLRRRTEKAKEMLMGTDLSISEVADLTGFAHQSHLAHWMRRESGTTPRAVQLARKGV